MPLTCSKEFLKGGLYRKKNSFNKSLTDYFWTAIFLSFKNGTVGNVLSDLLTISNFHILKMYAEKASPSKIYELEFVGNYTPSSQFFFLFILLWLWMSYHCDVELNILWHKHDTNVIYQPQHESEFFIFVIL